MTLLCFWFILPTVVNQKSHLIKFAGMDIFSSQQLDGANVSLSRRFDLSWKLII